MDNSELVIVSSALVLLTANIIVYSWSTAHREYRNLGRRIITLSAIIPGFVAVCWGVYIHIIGTDSTLGWTLFSAGMLLETGAIQLSLVLRKQAETDDKIS